MLEAGASVTDFTLLHEAIIQGYTKIVQLLIQYGADISRKYHTFSPVARAIKDNNPEIVKILITAGAALPESLLHTALENDNVEIAAMLFNAGVPLAVSKFKELENYWPHLLSPFKNSLREGDFYYHSSYLNSILSDYQDLVNRIIKDILPAVIAHLIMDFAQYVERFQRNLPVDFRCDKNLYSESTTHHNSSIKGTITQSRYKN